MLAPPDHFAVRPFSSAMVPRAQGFAAWSRLLNKWLISAEGKALSEDPFSISVRLRALPDIRYGWGSIGASHYERPRSVTSRENDDIVVLVNLGGSIIGNRGDQETALRPGEAYIMSCSERGSFTQPAGGNVLCLRVRHGALQPLTRGLNDKFGTVVPGDIESLKLLSVYLRTIGDTEPLTDDGVRHLTTRHVHELLALSLGAVKDFADIAQDGSLRAARLKAAKAIVQRHLTNPELRPEMIAGRLQLSLRSLQRLFESEGTTFSEFVTSERLAQAHAKLVDVRSATRNVAEIALGCGFSDISYFNRQFRARYRATPSEVRYHELLATGRGK
jgi:AraC-like DNA-binding protein